MLILASQSPRRQELLRLIAPEFEIFAADVDEYIESGTSPDEAVMGLALKKARTVADLRPDDTVIGADTVVVLDRKILGKPRDNADAAGMLRMLASNTHTVYTGVCIIQNGIETAFFEATDVTFTDMTEKEIAAYVETGEPLDKAGAYGIQGAAAPFISGIRGDFYNVMGLPVSTLYRRLQAIRQPEVERNTRSQCGADI